MTLPFKIILAATRTGGIGKNGALPWPKLETDLAYYSRCTRDTKTTSSSSLSSSEPNTGPTKPPINALIMGRRTWESMPSTLLRNQYAIVITSRTNIENQDNVLKTTISFPMALAAARTNTRVANIWVIGGAAIFEEALKTAGCEEVRLTQVMKEFDCDTVVPDLAGILSWSYTMDKHYPNIVIENGVPFQFLTYHKNTIEYITDITEIKVESECTAGHENKKTAMTTTPKSANIEERQFLDLVTKIIETGAERDDRTGVGTFSLFGEMLKYSLRNHALPLYTTKRVPFRQVVEELLWMLRGQTDGKILESKNVMIWKANGTKEFLSKQGQGHRRADDLGPIYGHQWRHFGAEYKDCDTDYTGCGVDQITNAINMIKTCPESRRIVVCAWNPVHQSQMALPPCHVLTQFYVHSGELSCILYQRSCDMGLGVPFNVASYALLTHVIAQVCGLKAGELTHMMGDAHVYKTHVKALKEQAAREPSAFPSIRFKKEIKDVFSWEFEDLIIENYTSQGTIKMEMAV